jgi:hypothetical protein
MAAKQESRKRATKNRGRPFSGTSSEERVGLRGRVYPVDSPSTHLPLTSHSPALRVSAGKSGVEGVE